MITCEKRSERLIRNGTAVRWDVSNERAAKPYLYVSRMRMWFAVAVDTYSVTMPPLFLRCGSEILDNVLSFSGGEAMEHGAARVLPACAMRHNH